LARNPALDDHGRAQQRATHEEALKHLRDIRALGLKERGGGPDHVVMHLASAHGLSAYDACHLSLAIEMGCELFSLDKELHAAWEAEKQTARPTPAETD
jgi:predicted nucleic acid-binding protein